MRSKKASEQCQVRVSRGPAQTPASGHSFCYLGMDFPSRVEGRLPQNQREGAECLQKHLSAPSALRTFRSSLSHGCNLFSRVKSFSLCSSPPSLLANRLVQCTVTPTHCQKSLPVPSASLTSGFLSSALTRITGRVPIAPFQPHSLSSHSSSF